MTYKNFKAFFIKLQEVQKFFLSCKQLIYLGLIISGIFIVNIFLYYKSKNFESSIINTYLNTQLLCIQNLIFKDIYNIYEDKYLEHLTHTEDLDKKSQGFKYENGLIAYIYKNNSFISVDFSNLIDLIDEIAKNNFIYYIKLNDKVLNSSYLKEIYGITHKSNVLNNNLIIKLQLLEDSSIKLEIARRIKENTWYRVFISGLIFSLSYYIILKYHRRINQIQSLQTNINNVIIFYKEETARIIKRYEYTKKDTELLERLDSAGLIHDIKTKNYFPLFLSQQVSENQIYALNIKTLNFGDLVSGYNLINNSNIKLQIHNKTEDNNIYSFLENEVLIQIVESIVRNFLQLKRNTNDKAIITITRQFGIKVYKTSELKLNFIEGLLFLSE